MKKKKKKKRLKSRTKARAQKSRYTAQDRENVLGLVGDFLAAQGAVDGPLPMLYYEFFGDVDDQLDYADPETMDNIRERSQLAFLYWSCFDVDAGGERLVDIILEKKLGRDPGVCAYLRAMRNTRQRLYEVLVVEPGASLTVRDVIDGSEVKVCERLGSRYLQRGQLLATRVMRPGHSGGPEMDGGIFNYSEGQRGHVLAALHEKLDLLAEEMPEASEDERWRRIAPLLHEEWRTVRMPRLVNYDGDPMMVTSVHFEVRRADALAAAFDGESTLERDPETGRWTWTGLGSDREEPVILGWMVLDAEKGRLVFETNSAERGKRGRALIEGLAGQSVVYRTTVLEDVMQKTLEAGRSGSTAGSDEEHDPAVREQLRDMTYQLYIEHQRKWIDEPVPMLGDKTPREASRIPAAREKLVELLELGDRHYESALADGHPTVDPHWVREELGVPDERRRRDPSRPPPLAHERMAELVPELRDLATTIASRVRRQPDYSPERSIERSELIDDLGFSRFIRDHEREAVWEHADPETAATSAELFASHLGIACNLELHHRKVFWVGEGLSWMLGATNLDVPGEALKLPFGSFALAFTDRYALSLAERMLSRQPDCRIRGHLLEAVTVYVTQVSEPAGLRIAIACDLLDHDWPYLVVRQLDVRPDDSLDAIVDSHFPESAAEEFAAIFACTPLRELLRLALNAILYATSADAEHSELRPARRPRSRHKEKLPPLTSETVFHLPGTIDIGALREIKRAHRGFTDREQVHRCMVRGHWRGANRSWKDQRPRWIAPHWRGPSVAAVVERAYRLKK